MASTGDTLPTSGTSVDRSGATAWTNPGYITADDTNYTTAVVPTDYLIASGFGFNIPTDSYINGVTVKVNASETGTGSSNYVPQLISDTTPTLIGSAKTAVSVSGTTKVTSTNGGTTDRWGATLTPAVVNSAGFGVAIWSTDTVNTLSIDFITIAIEYTPPVALTGVGATSAVSTSTTQKVSLTATGVAGTGAVGTPTPSVSYGATLTGVEATGAVGTPSRSVSKDLTGVEATGAVGAPTPSEFTGEYGTAWKAGAWYEGAWEGTVWADVVTGVDIGLTGVEATGAVNTLGLSSSLSLTGAEATGAVGAPTRSVSIALTGVAATGAVGSVTPQLWWAVDDLTITAGSITSGAITDTRRDDGARLVLAETTGTPGFDYTFVFNNVPEKATAVLFDGRYEGNVAHVVKIYQWNFNSSAWEALTEATTDFPSSGTDSFKAFHLHGSSGNYVSGGELRVRIAHVSAGNTIHEFNVDRLILASWLVTGAEATGAVGTLSLSVSKALTGLEATGAVGAPATSAALGLTGVGGVGDVGDLGLSVSVTADGLEATGATGDLGLSASLALTGQEATGEVGDLTPTSGVVVALSGAEATGAVGAPAPSAALELTGQEAAGSVGDLTPVAGYFVELSGQAATGETGDLSLSVSTSLSGQEAAGDVGDLSLSSAITLSGQEASGSAGDVTPTSGVVVGLTGLGATGAVGSTDIAAALGLTGLEISVSAGTVTPVSGIFVALTGLAATGAVGSTSRKVSKTLGGLAATGAVWSWVTPPAPLPPAGGGVGGGMGGGRYSLRHAYEDREDRAEQIDEEEQAIITAMAGVIGILKERKWL